MKLETEAEKKRRIAIFLMLKRRDEQQTKPAPNLNNKQAADLYKIREQRKEIRNG